MLLAGVACTRAQVEIPDSSPADFAYHIRPRDEVRVTVLGHEDLATKVQVSAEGTVALRLLGEVKARGLTEAQLASDIESRLADGYIKKPEVSVQVVTYAESIFVVGEVQRPGVYPFRPELTVIQALTLAGGPTQKAATKKARVLRPAEGGSRSVVHPEPWDRLQPDDVLIIPQRFF
jgi:polysaccharide export outer membrane protein